MTTFTLPTADLKRAAAQAKPAAYRAARGGLPILTGARLELSASALRITCTDLDLTITTTADGRGDGEAIAIVGADAMAKNIPAGKGSTTITTGEGFVTFNHGPSLPTVTLPTMPAEEWPRLEHGAGGATLALAPFAEVLPAVETDEVRPILCQVNLQGREVAATDSYRLHVSNRSSAEPELDGMVPGRLVKNILKAAKAAKCDGATLAFFADGRGRRMVTMAAGAMVATAVACEGEFPAYRKLIPENLPNVLDLSGALPAIDASRKAGDKLDKVTFDVNGAVAIEGAGGAVTMEVPLGSSTPSGIRFAFNPRYLADALADTDCQLQYTDALKPALIRTSSGIRLVMPVRIS